MSNLFSDLKSILHLILVSKNVLLRKVFIFLDLLSLTFVSQVYINVRDWKSFQTPILKLLELFGRWKFDRLCILSYFLISEDILAVLPPLTYILFCNSNRIFSKANSSLFMYAFNFWFQKRIFSIRLRTYNTILIHEKV